MYVQYCTAPPSLQYRHLMVIHRSSSARSEQRRRRRCRFVASLPTSSSSQQQRKTHGPRALLEKRCERCAAERRSHAFAASVAVVVLRDKFIHRRRCQPKTATTLLTPQPTPRFNSVCHTIIISVFISSFISQLREQKTESGRSWIVILPASTGHNSFGLVFFVPNNSHLLHQLLSSQRS